MIVVEYRIMGNFGMWGLINYVEMTLSLYWQNFYWTMQGLYLFSSGYLEYHISLNSLLYLA